MAMVVRKRWLVGLAVACLGAYGCQKGSVSSESTSLDHPSDASTVKERETESWDVIYLQDQPVGWQSLRLSRIDEKGQAFFDGVLRSELTVQRFGQTTRELAEVSSRQDTRGRLVGLRTAVGSGSGQSITVGHREGDSLQLEGRQGNDKRTWELVIPPDCGGCFAVEWSLREKPLGPGERRQLRAIVPLIHQVATIDLEGAAVWERLSFGGEEKKLLPVRQIMSLEGQTIDSTLWMDSMGSIWKTEIPVIRQVTMRTAEAEARRRMLGASFDLGSLATVRVAEPIASPHETMRIRYRIQGDSREVVEVFPQAMDQRLRWVNDRTVEVVVDRTSSGKSDRDIPVEAPSERDKSSSQMIQSDDPDVRAMAAEIPQLAEELPALVRAQAVERYVHQAISAKNFSTAFASAAEVARSREGDCTEHAVLTAALCRAGGIPARIVMGLVYVPAEQGFVFHMWNEVWLGQSWQPIDSTLGLGHIGAAHLVVARSSLATESTWSALLPVLSVMGRIQIEILEVVPAP